MGLAIRLGAGLRGKSRDCGQRSEEDTPVDAPERTVAMTVGREKLSMGQAVAPWARARRARELGSHPAEPAVCVGEGHL